MVYVAYTEDIADIPRQHGLHNHMHADDIQLYVEVAVADVHSALNRLSDCVSDVKDWCSSRRLQLNDAKTDIAWFGSHANLIKMANVDCSLSIDDVTVKPSTVVRDLGVLLDSELTLQQHISKVLAAAIITSDGFVRSVVSSAVI